MSDIVPVDLGNLNARDGWILEIRINLKGGIEVAPILVEPLMAIILCTSCLHGFLHSVEITQENRSESRRNIYHKLCGWG